MSTTTVDSVIRQDLTRTAAKAIQNACTALRYQCIFIEEMASFGYGGSNPPTKLEVMVIPKTPNKKLVSTDALKRSIASLSTGVDGIFTVFPINISPTVLSFQHNRFLSQWKTMVIDITIASNIDVMSIQPLQNMNGLCYPCPEYVLARILGSWIQTQNSQPLSLSTRNQYAHHNREIEPILRHMAKMQIKLTDWRVLQVRHIIKYCGVYPDSTELWIGLGLLPIVVRPPKISSNSLKPTSSITQIPSAPFPRSQNAARSPPSSLSSTPTLIEHVSASLPPIGFSKVTATLQTHPESPNNTPRIKMLFLAAQRTIELLQSLGLPSAILGSLACFMYGNRRPPNDVNILVLPSPDRDLRLEEVKMLLAANDAEHFFMAPSKDAKPGTKFLFYRLEKAGSSRTPFITCKVDLVLPGTYDLPSLPTSKINWDEGLPLIPFSLLLLQKLQSWEYHRHSLDKLTILKQRTDVEVEDLREMFELDLVEELKHSVPWVWADNQVFSRTFLHNSLSRAHKFCGVHPDTIQCWRRVGLIP